MCATFFPERARRCAQRKGGGLGASRRGRSIKWETVDKAAANGGGANQGGSAGYSRRLEGIQVVLVRKGQPAPGATYRGVTQRYATPVPPALAAPARELPINGGNPF